MRRRQPAHDLGRTTNAAGSSETSPSRISAWSSSADKIDDVFLARVRLCQRQDSDQRVAYSKLRMGFAPAPRPRRASRRSLAPSMRRNGPPGHPPKSAEMRALGQRHMVRYVSRNGRQPEHRIAAKAVVPDRRSGGATLAAATLNCRSSCDGGSGGIEQRGEPPYFRLAK